MKKNKFYKKHTDKFFKNRHWLTREFSELKTDETKTLMEVGCGVGNTAFPLYEELFPRMNVICFDFAEHAISIVRETISTKIEECKSKYPTENSPIPFIKTFVWDVTEKNIPDDLVPDESIDFVTMIFVLSAMSPGLKMQNAIRHISKKLKSGGIIFVRDYGAADLALHRLSGKEQIRKLDDNFYARGDGTRSYYFTLESLAELFDVMQFECIENKFCEKRVVNNERELTMDRIFVQGKFKKL